MTYFAVTKRDEPAVERLNRRIEPPSPYTAVSRDKVDAAKASVWLGIIAVAAGFWYLVGAVIF